MFISLALHNVALSRIGAPLRLFTGGFAAFCAQCSGPYDARA
jgi:hypothetical protein